MKTKKVCGCGQKTKNLSGVCDKCREKIIILNRIRDFINSLPSEKRKRSKAKYETYLAFKPNRGYKDGKDQLCWYCEKAGGLCSWSKDFTPVEGWEAEPDVLRIREKENGVVQTYYIKACPEYEPLKTLRESKY